MAPSLLEADLRSRFAAASDSTSDRTGNGWDSYRRRSWVSFSTEDPFLLLLLPPERRRLKKPIGYERSGEEAKLRDGIVMGGEVGRKAQVEAESST